MTREQVELICKNVRELGRLGWEADKLQMNDAEQRDLINRLQLEAQIHAQEARTANATIAEIYQVVSGGTGEPGNWHGVEPVRTVMQEQREEITRLRGELSHWTFVRFKELEAENEQLRESLQGIIDIGKRDMTNPKYDGYFEAAKKALTQEPT